MALWYQLSKISPRLASVTASYRVLWFYLIPLTRINMRKRMKQWAFKNTPPQQLKHKIRILPYNFLDFKSTWWWILHREKLRSPATRMQAALSSVTLFSALSRSPIIRHIIGTHTHRHIHIFTHLPLHLTITFSCFYFFRIHNNFKTLGLKYLCG